MRAKALEPTLLQLFVRWKTVPQKKTMQDLKFFFASHYARFSSSFFFRKIIISIRCKRKSIQHTIAKYFTPFLRSTRTKWPRANPREIEGQQWQTMRSISGSAAPFLLPRAHTHTHILPRLRWFGAICFWESDNPPPLALTLATPNDRAWTKKTVPTFLPQFFFRFDFNSPRILH